MTREISPKQLLKSNFLTGPVLSEVGLLPENGDTSFVIPNPVLDCEFNDTNLFASCTENCVKFLPDRLNFDHYSFLQ